MGTWNSKLYGNDYASDVRDTYVKILEITQDPLITYQYTLAEYEEEFDDEEPLFWYVLADQQLEYGVLCEKVKQIAIEWIDKDGGINLWKNAKRENEWKTTLLELKNRLNSAPPIPKKLPKLCNINVWEIGDVYAIKLERDFFKEFGLKDRYIALMKTAQGSSWGLHNASRKYPEAGNIAERFPFFRIFNCVFDSLPLMEDVNELTFMEIITGFDSTFVRRDKGFSVWDKNLRQYPDRILTKIGHKNEPEEILDRQTRYKSTSGWKNIDLEIGEFVFTIMGNEISWETARDNQLRYLEKMWDLF